MESLQPRDASFPQRRLSSAASHAAFGKWCLFFAGAITPWHVSCFSPGCIRRRTLVKSHPMYFEKMQRSFAKLDLLRAMFPIVTWCTLWKKSFGKLPGDFAQACLQLPVPVLLQSRTFFKSRTYFFTVWLWSSGAKVPCSTQYLGTVRLYRDKLPIKVSAERLHISCTYIYIYYVFWYCR